MIPESVIRAKRDGEELSGSTIRDFIFGFVKGDVADYQMSAFLMTVTLRGMTSAETVDLTRAMAESGERFDFSNVSARKVDKHSTGGVGDMISLPLVPLVAACGVAVPMIAGRGLGHTGGTIDKLESIPGFRTHLDRAEFTHALQQVGGAIGGQTQSIAPADRRMYAIRDVTATVESLPLLVSSILSKKLAAGLDALVLDVKCGSGAFLPDEKDALRLAQALVTTADGLGLPAVAFVTDMDAPLGRAVGNAVEIASTIDCLNGQGPDDVMELVYTLGTAMLCLAEPEVSWDKHRAHLESTVRDGSGFMRFEAMIHEQGGDARVAANPKLLPSAEGRHEVVAERDGWVSAIDARTIGRALVGLGGGRKKAEDEIDPSVGFLFERRVGDKVARGDTLVTVLGRTDEDAARSGEDVLRAFSIESAAPERRPLVRHLVTRDRVTPWHGSGTWSEIDLPGLLRTP
jgi:pyrimidine-nucleoside phosphorylase